MPEEKSFAKSDKLLPSRDAETESKLYRPPRIKFTITKAANTKIPKVNFAFSFITENIKKCNQPDYKKLSECI